MHKILGAILGALLLTTLPAQAANLVKNSGFKAGIDPWWKTPMSLKMTIIDGALCMNVPGGSAEIWDVIVGQNDIPLKSGVKYRFSFKAQAKPNATIRGLVQIPMPPWTPYASIDQELTVEQQTYSVDFTPTEGRKNAQVAFQFGGSAEPWILCLDDVAVTNLN